MSCSDNKVCLEGIWIISGEPPRLGPYIAFEVVHRAEMTNLDADGLSCKVLWIMTWSGPHGMGIVMERRFLVGNSYLPHFVLALLVRFWYREMRLIKLKLSRIYGRFFPYCISFIKGPFLWLFYPCKGIGLDTEQQGFDRKKGCYLVVVGWDKAICLKTILYFLLIATSARGPKPFWYT